VEGAPPPDYGTAAGKYFWRMARKPCASAVIISNEPNLIRKLGYEVTIFKTGVTQAASAQAGAYSS
jgi:hypothetical protein